MKICFFLQRRFADVGHTIICNLKESFGFNQFCAYVSVRKSYDFLKNQKEIAYTSLILDEDVHASLYKETIDYVYLKQLEKDYGIPNLWPYLCIDRILMQGQLLREYPHDEPLLSYEEMQKAIQVTSKAIIGFLEKEKPDAVVISVVGSLASLLLYHIAKKKGILTINIDLIRVKNRVGFTEDYKTFSWAKKIFEKVINGQQKIDLTKAQTFLKEFRDKPASYIKHATPEYNNQAKRIGNITFLRPDKLLRSVKWQFKSIARDIWRTHKDYTDILIWWEIWDKFKRKIRGLIGYSDLYSEVREEDFAFFALHYEPEVAIALYAPHYTDQIHVIKQLAQSLPLNYKLYIKEHAVMVGYRTRSYYKELIKIPNVRLISPMRNGHDLVQKAKLVVTLTGTVGWEAIMFKKPVITLGDVYYNDLSFVRRCKSFEDLPYIVKDQLDHFIHDEDELQVYLAALIDDSVEVNYVDLWRDASSFDEIRYDPGIKRFSELLGKKLLEK